MRNPISLPLLAILLLGARVDEGQWLPGQIRAMDWDKLRARGLEITRDQLWNPERGGLLNAAVQIGGCSASFVSSRGLLISNQHCGYSEINRLSTLEKNYLEEGFLARSREEELPTHIQVAVARRIENVTDRVHAAQARATTPLERYALTEREIKKIVEEAQTDPSTGKRDPKTTCSVATFFEGREYHLYYRTLIDDVRLVCSPPVSTGEFGGNTDNWEWPRHSGDFAFFRAYVAPDGTPRQYHPDNVPYEPEHFLHVSAKGVQERDLVLIIGYPARTARYLSSVALETRQAVVFPERHEILSRILAVLATAIDGDPARALELASTIKSIANVEKNALGMIKGFARNAIVERKLREEEAFAHWVRRSEQTAKRFGSVLQNLKDLDHEVRRTIEKDSILRLIMWPLVADLTPLLRTTMRIVHEARGMTNGSPHENSAELMAEVRSPSELTNLASVQKPVLAILLEEVRNLPQPQQLAGSEILPDSDVAPEAMVDWLLAQTGMRDPEERVRLLEGGQAAIEASKDPLVVLARGLDRERALLEQRNHVREGRRLLVGPRWIEAQQAWRGKSFYPDANSTLRISIAEVKGYYPRDGVYYAPFTTVAGMLRKDSGKIPFKVEDHVRAASYHRKTSRFMNERINDVPVCFLADGDTTGGNSGSPVINGKGELVGINFDRVFENVSCDYGWDPDRSRNISLDIRFVLWHLESVMPAPRLLAEMGL